MEVNGYSGATTGRTIQLQHDIRIDLAARLEWSGSIHFGITPISRCFEGQTGGIYFRKGFGVIQA